jgi:hypothetical protein
MVIYYPVKQTGSYKSFGIFNLSSFWITNYQILDENGQSILRRFSKGDLAIRLANKICLNELENGELKRKIPSYDYKHSGNKTKIFPLGKLEFFLFKKNFEKLNRN